MADVDRCVCTVHSQVTDELIDRLLAAAKEWDWDAVSASAACESALRPDEASTCAPSLADRQSVGIDEAHRT